MIKFLFLLFTMLNISNAATVLENSNDENNLIGVDSNQYLYQIFSKENTKSLMIEHNQISVTQNDLSFLENQIDNMVDLVWSNSYQNQSIAPIYVLKIINLSSNIVASRLRESSFKLKNATGIKSDKGFSKSFKLKTEDTDGIYVGYINKFLGTTSRGYYVKKYDDIEEINKQYYFVNYIEIGKVNFKEAIASELSSYMKLNSNEETLPPLLLSYSHYKSTFGIVTDAIGESGYTETDESSTVNLQKEAGYNAMLSAEIANSFPLCKNLFNSLDGEDCIPHWSGFINPEPPVSVANTDTGTIGLTELLNNQVIVANVDTVKMVRENEDSFSFNAIKNSLSNISYVEDSFLINNRYKSEEIFGKGEGDSLSLFLEDGDIFNYNSIMPFENLNVHMQVASSFMAINNIRRGFVFSNNADNFNIRVSTRTYHKKKWGICYKEQKGYIQHASWGGSELYSINYIDESYIDNWDSMEVFNNNIKLGPIIAPTIIPINVSSKLPSLNKKNYLMTYSFNYLGSTYASEYELMNINPYIRHTLFNITSNEYKTAWGWTTGLAIIVSVLAVVFTGGALLGLVVVAAMVSTFDPTLGSRIMTFDQFDFNVDTQSTNTSIEVLTEEFKTKIDTIIYSMNILTKEDVIKDVDFKEEVEKSSIFNSLRSTPETSSLDKIKYNTGFDSYAQLKAISGAELFDYKNELNQNIIKRNEPILTTLLSTDNCNRFWCGGNKVDSIVTNNLNILKNGGTSNLENSPYDIKNTFKVIVHNYIGD